METYTVGVITDGQLGCNLAYRLSSKDVTAVLYNTDIENMQRIDINRYVENVQDGGALVATSLEMLFNILSKPRKVLIVSRSGSFSERILQDIYGLVEDGDIIIDTCDTNYKISANRCRSFEKKNVFYFGSGLSSTDSDVLKGASIMVGGPKDAFDRVYEVLENISSRYNNSVCCKYIGPDGAGQYVKMIHNGIEYGVMQAITEAISILKNVVGIDRTQISEILYDWSIEENEGYLLQVANDILSRQDEETDFYLTDIVSDKVGYNKTVIWLCSNAAELSVPVPSIYGALNHRFVSVMQRERNEISTNISNSNINKEDVFVINDRKKAMIEDVKNSLYLSTLCIYAQAFHLLKRASDLYIWGVIPVDVAISFQGGSFIRSRVLQRVIDAYRKKTDLKFLFEDSYFISKMQKYLPALRRTASISIEYDLPVPVLSESLSYLNSIKSGNLESGIIELMRDYIQSSGFEMKNIQKKRYTADWFEFEKKTVVNEIVK